MNETNTHNYDSLSELLPETENSAANNSNQNNTTINEQTASKASQEFLKNADWYAIARKIRQSNRQLVQKVMDLESLIKDYETRLESQQRRCRSADNLIEQQAQELNNSQEEMAHIYNQLQTANEQYQNQQILVEKLSQDLQASQEQIARLERECSLLQDNYNQQKNQLLQTEKENRELQVRLQRQQRYTLQYKSALDQCLEAPNQENINQIFEKQIAAKIKKIQPWSNYQEENKKDVNSSLYRKLLATQESEISETNFQELAPINEQKDLVFPDFSQENLPTTQEYELEDIKLSKETNQLEEMPSFQSEKALKNEQENISLPSWDKQEINPVNQIISSPVPSVLIDNTNSDEKNKKKNFLELPKLPKFLN